MLYVQLLLHTEMQVAQSILTPVAGSSIAVNQHKLLILKEIALTRAELIKFAMFPVSACVEDQNL